MLLVVFFVAACVASVAAGGNDKYFKLQKKGYACKTSDLGDLLEVPKIECWRRCSATVGCGGFNYIKDGGDRFCQMTSKQCEAKDLTEDASTTYFALTVVKAKSAPKKKQKGHAGCPDPNLEDGELAALSDHPDMIRDGCPEDFYSGAGLESCYAAFGPANVSAATEKCNSFGGELLVIESLNEDKWVTDFLDGEITYRIDHECGAKSPFNTVWIGIEGTADNQTDEWQYRATGMPIDSGYTVFESNKRSGVVQGVCAYRKSSKAWVPESCNKERAFVCEVVRCPDNEHWQRRGRSCYHIHANQAYLIETGNMCAFNLKDAEPKSDDFPTPVAVALDTLDEAHWMQTWMTEKKAPSFTNMGLMRHYGAQHYMNWDWQATRQAVNVPFRDQICHFEEYSGKGYITRSRSDGYSTLELAKENCLNNTRFYPCNSLSNQDSNDKNNGYSFSGTKSPSFAFTNDNGYTTLDVVCNTNRAMGYIWDSRNSASVENTQAQRCGVAYNGATSKYAVHDVDCNSAGWGVCEIARCPIGYLTYDGSCYKFPNKKMTYIEARNYCSQDGAELLSVETPGHQKFVDDYVNRHFRSDSRFWMGAYRETGLDAYTWLHSGHHVAPDRRVNLALHKPTYFKVQYGDWRRGAYATDGTVNRDRYGLGSSTPNWITVDLGESFEIGTVAWTAYWPYHSSQPTEIYVSEIAPKDFDEFLAQTKNVTEKQLCVRHEANFVKPSGLDLMLSNCTAPLKGRFVTIRSLQSQYLQMYEIEVYLAKSVAPWGRGDPVKRDNKNIGCMSAKVVGGKLQWLSSHCLHKDYYPICRRVLRA